MKAEKKGKSLIIDDKVIEFEQRIEDIVVLDDRAIILLRVNDFLVGDPLVGQNVVAFDRNGEVLWRIAPTGRTRPRPDGSQAPEAYFGLGFAQDGKTVQVGTLDGFDYDIDIETGELSNPVFTK